MTRRRPGRAFGATSYDKFWWADILSHAYDLARANQGARGVDGVTFEQIDTMGLPNWLTQLEEELRTQTYRCQPLRQVMIPKPGGPSVSRQSRTGWCRPQRNWYWNQSLKRTWIA